jgi:hypothetical protein
MPRGSHGRLQAAAQLMVRAATMQMQMLRMLAVMMWVRSDVISVMGFEGQ